MTLDKYVLERVEQYAPAELKKQKQERNTFHRRAYANIVRDFIALDPLGALISYVKASLQIKYSMEHKILWIIPPRVVHGFELPGVAYPDDWSFPIDPWKREWWSK